MMNKQQHVRQIHRKDLANVVLCGGSHMQTQKGTPNPKSSVWLLLFTLTVPRWKEVWLQMWCDMDPSTMEILMQL